MSRARNGLLIAGILATRTLLAQSSGNAALPSAQKDSASPAKPSETDELPPEEDASQNAPKQYGFNPVQSKREVEVGVLYYRKGNYKAAAGRFLEATKWNDGNADAWLRLGEAQEKRGDTKAARDAYRHYLEAAPDAKNAGDIRKRIERLK